MSINNEDILEHLIRGDDLEPPTVRILFDRILSRSMPDAQIAATLSLLRAKGANYKEIAAAVDAVLQKALLIYPPPYLYGDVVGTGGDYSNTINVSTMASLTAASCGFPVAKHGNVSVSSKCGSADLLKELGIDIEMQPSQSRRCLDQANWCFLFAPIYHPTFQSVKSLRRELRIKTIFNILGPLSNPLAPPVMLVGVYDEALLMPFAQALKDLKRKRALIVFGAGLDEIAVHAPTRAVLLDQGHIETLLITPEDLGLMRHEMGDLKGGDINSNAILCKEVLSGRGDRAKIDFVAASAGALLWLGERALSLKQGVVMARDALCTGLPKNTLQQILELSNGPI